MSRKVLACSFLESIRVLSVGPSCICISICICVCICIFICISICICICICNCIYICIFVFCLMDTWPFTTNIKKKIISEKRDCDGGGGGWWKPEFSMQHDRQLAEGGGNGKARRTFGNWIFLSAVFIFVFVFLSVWWQIEQQITKLPNYLASDLKSQTYLVLYDCAMIWI